MGIEVGIDFGHSNRGAVPKWPKGMVCKTIIRRFESDPRLQFSRFEVFSPADTEMELSSSPGEKGFRVRLMSPLGRYPADSFCSESAALIVSPEICFSIVRMRRNTWSATEREVLTELEVPLFGSILLAGKEDEPQFYPYPTSHWVFLEIDSFEDRHILECKSSLLERLQKKMGEHQTDFFHKPPSLGGVQYEFAPSGADDDRRLVLRHLQTVANPIILRGVSCLLKAQMAFQHHEFGEAACIFSWIALDAAHSLVLQKLRQSGIANPTSEDAARYFEKISGYGTEWEKFFEDDYENRIRSIHPDNRFGAEAIPQFLADDFYDLNEMLIPLFYFFVTDV